MRKFLLLVPVQQGEEFYVEWWRASKEVAFGCHLWVNQKSRAIKMSKIEIDVIVKFYEVSTTLQREIAIEEVK